jgi:GAF domain-containing protein
LYASQAAVALENVRLYQDALKANERRAVLHWASQEIVTAGRDAERVYAAIHEATARLMPCESFVIAILDEANDQIQLVYLYDRGGRQPSGVIARSRGISGHVIASGEPLTVDDLAESDLDVVNFGAPQKVASLLAVPLRHGGKVVGMLSAQAYEKKAFTTDDRLVLEMLAAHAATAVVNLRASGPNALIE